MCKIGKLPDPSDKSGGTRMGKHWATNQMDCKSKCLAETTCDAFTYTLNQQGSAPNCGLIQGFVATADLKGKPTFNTCYKGSLHLLSSFFS